MSQDVALPFGGVSDELPADRQAPSTTRYGPNVQGWDEVEKRPAMAMRPGQVKHASAVLTADTKVQAICDLTYDVPNVTYTALGNSVTTDTSTTVPGLGSCAHVVRDDLGRFYALDTNAGVQVYTADLQKIARIPAPTLERGATLRALCVDDTGRVMFAVSGGGDPNKAAIFCYEPIEERKYKLLWQVPDRDIADQDPEDVGWFTEELLVDAQGSGTTLYAAQNNPVTRKSRVAVYTDLGVPNPTRVKTWDAYRYPINGMDQNPVDSAIGLAHEPNTQAGQDPRSPETTGPLDDMTIEEVVANSGARIRAWHSSMDVDGDGTNNANRVDGDIISTWKDKSGNDRHWFAGAILGDVGAVLRKGAVAGRDTLFFDGALNTYRSAAGINTAFQFRKLNKTVIPTHAKGQFVVICVVRAPMSTGQRVIWGQAKSNSGSQDERGVLINSSFNAGVIDAPGNVLLYEQPVTGQGQNGRVNGATGFTTVLPGAYDADGLLMVTYVFDHGYDDIAGTPTRSQLRINGRPVDRWTSRTGYESLERTILGMFVYPNGSLSGSRFLGDFMEFFVVEDWHQVGFGATSSLQQQRLMETPTYPDAGWSAGSDTTLERLEGLFAHRRGMAHKLPTGNAAVLEGLGVGSVNDTITIAGDVYTLKAAPTTTAFEVRIGASAFATLQNLMHAINGSGVPGTDYGSATTRNAAVWCTGVLENGTTNGPALTVQRRDARITTTFAVAESTATVRFNWVSGANSVTSLDPSGRNFGHYPHPFFLYKTAQSPGGPPRVAGVAQDSMYSGLLSPYGTISVWDPANGRLKAILSTAGPGYNLPFGGLGYGIRFNSAGDVYSIGPRQAAVTDLGLSADNIDVRKLVLLASGFVSTDGNTALLNWSAAPGAQTYQYPRMAVDKWDNLFVPIYQSANGTSAVVYKKVSAAGVAAISTVTTLTNGPKGMAIAVDGNWPEFPAAFTDPRAERFLLATERFSTSATTTLYVLRLCSAAAARTVTRASKRLAACGPKLFLVAKGASPTELEAAAFSSTALLIDHCVINANAENANKVAVFVDGEQIRIFDPKASTFGNLRARFGGEIPKRPKLVERYKNRLAFARMADAPTRLVMSASGDIYGWNFNPVGDDAIPVAAYRSDLTTTGDHGDVITCLQSIHDEVLFVGGQRSVAVLDRDPMQGGQLQTIWEGSGVAFGRASCVTPDRTTWWVTNEGEFAALPYGSKEPKIMSRKIAKRFQEAMDFSKFMPELAWDPYRRCIHIVLIPIGAGANLGTHWTYWPDTGAFWPVTYGALGIQPTAICVGDGATVSTRGVILGSRDGYTRDLDGTAGDDDGTLIEAGFDIGPLSPQGAEMEALFSNLTVVLARAQGTARYEAHVLDLPDETPVVSVDSGELLPGYNTPTARFSGQFCLLRIGSSTLHDRFSVVRVSMNAEVTGMARDRVGA